MPFVPGNPKPAGSGRRAGRSTTAHPKGTRRSQGAFLAAYARCGTIRDAAAAVGIDRGNHYRWMASDVEYQEAFRSADAEVTGMLEDEAIHRATVGCSRPVLHQGEQVYLKQPCPDCNLADRVAARLQGGEKCERCYGLGHIEVPLYEFTKSDTCLIFLLKARRPNVYRERAAIEHTGKDGAPLLTMAMLDAMLAAHPPEALDSGSEGG